MRLDLLEAAEIRSAVNELQEDLSWWAHHTRSGVLRVRTRLDRGDVIVVDVAKQFCTPEIDRFTLAYPGNQRSVITATAGTLGRTRHTQTFKSQRDARAWMLATLQLVSE